MLSLCRIIISLLLVGLSGQAAADISNSPNPYDAGYGFDTPDEAGWGGWMRGGASTLYAEWDTISDASYGGSGDRTAAPDIGTHNVADAYLSWNPGVFVTSTGNLITPSVVQEFFIRISPVSLFSGPLVVALQVEMWGDEPAAPLLNGLAASSWTRTFTGTSVTDHDLNQYLGLWYFANTVNHFEFDLTNQPFISLAQVAVDIAQVSEPYMLAIMLTGLILIGSMTRYRSRPI
ncbi:MULTISPECIES: hypothetical protein [Nitrosomonas]|uniref:PEP-CTERM protein-sorting domain-containing protein n=3 Tax=Nitrosomonas TaxID=914 RepID=Q82WF4_NITEU|nr:MULTISPECIES: hypothetical protein [Nitrosomonas]CAD84637.1 hypothetical protein NE0726 [Nitrosomonas europaea ATCC 19718]SDW74438.1 hypothetical protein SAMN05216310_13418 [Nitrosomonas europaea]SET28925.1 hypothetical protein SAMN05216309_13119 [Nitrosomonas europaea]SJZ84755.1 hypothetical protein SAMN02745113_02025 [Nitrosomonas europaea]HBF24544.1 VPLPA-CTERM sorting domain-containing protein [Nitrosomonas sp.]